ncbi:MAG: hypothetical protein LBC38_03820 [Oscillospiraceae bacterium]|jgi:hypothetical protein|nr:hypothetical protein [Oscillospiraceae bacterium]
MIKTKGLTGKRLSEVSEGYFAERVGKAVSVSDWCSWLGISLEEWQDLKKQDGLKLASKRIETKIRALVEVDEKRPATVTTLLLKQFAENEGEEVVFKLRVNS